MSVAAPPRFPVTGQSWYNDYLWSPLSFHTVLGNTSDNTVPFAALSAHRSTPAHDTESAHLTEHRFCQSLSL